MIRIVAVGKVREKWIREGISEYIKRMGAKLDVVEVKDMGQEKEGERMLSLVKGAVVCMDEHGKSMGSVDFADLLKQHPDVTFLIGSADGLSNEVLMRNYTRISLSRMTFTHEMARLLLFEQIYRGLMINANRPYHRG